VASSAAAAVPVGPNALVEERTGFKASHRIVKAKEFDRIVKGVITLTNGSTLCSLVRRYPAGGGVFRVEAIVATLEESAKRPGELESVTYVKLHTIARWTDGVPEEMVARIRGGIRENGRLGGWTVELKVGEKYGILFSGPDANRGLVAFGHPGVFRKNKGGCWTNGELFTQAACGANAMREHLGHVFENGRPGRVACERDIEPDWRKRQPRRRREGTSRRVWPERVPEMPGAE